MDLPPAAAVKAEAATDATMHMPTTSAGKADLAKACAAAATTSAAAAAAIADTAQHCVESESCGCMPFMRVLKGSKGSASGKTTASLARRVLCSFKSSPADVKAKFEAAKAASDGKTNGPSFGKKLSNLRRSAGQAVTGFFKITRQ
jgi:hypothetical protein